MSKILLLSIRPRHDEKIFAGEKAVELRRTKPRVETGDLVLVYTSSPRCALTGDFVVANLVTGTPEAIWRKCGSKAEIERAWTFDRPVTLRELRRRMKGFHPPQSYRYVPRVTASSLIAKGAGRGTVRPQGKA
jgi:predicted transcriptional regulator